MFIQRKWQKYHQLDINWSVKLWSFRCGFCQTLSIPPPSVDIPPVSWPHLLETPFPPGLSLHLSPDTTQKWPGRMRLSWVSSLSLLPFSVSLNSILGGEESFFLCHGDVSLCSKNKHCLLSTDAGSPEGTHSAAVPQSTGSQRDPSGEKHHCFHISASLRSISWPSCCSGCRSSEDDLHEGVRSFKLLPKAQQKRPQIPGRD